MLFRQQQQQGGDRHHDARAQHRREEGVQDTQRAAGLDPTTPLIVAGSGERGLSLIEKENYDVVVTDLRMGEIDGLTLLRKTKEELPDAEVILLTGHASVQSALAAGQAGASMYLTKPLDISELPGSRGSHGGLGARLGERPDKGE